ncbi:MAG: flagellar export chaperone FliS [Planctomycetota bacterium]|nr:flagellar export chaperone FliS [Planctomycetota bacterium]
MTHNATIRNVADHYLESAVENAPPIKLVRMLVEGSVRFLDRAIATSPKENRKAFVAWAKKADAIVIELRLSLVPIEGSDIAPNLEKLYLFCEERIGKALLHDDPQPLREARQVLAVLLDAWLLIETPTGEHVDG